jgi:hypothetical protein
MSLPATILDYTHEMGSEVSRAVSSAVQWAIVGIAIGVLPTYVLVEERAKKDKEAAVTAAASSAAAAVYAAWSATPPPVCPAPPITVATVVSVTGAAPQAQRGPTRIDAPKKDDDDMKMLMPMLNMAQGMVNGNNGGGGGQPDFNEVMKNMPKK